MLRNRFLIGLVTFLVGLFAGQKLVAYQYKDRVPLFRMDPDGTAMYGWRSSSGIREDYTDQDRDGVAESWSVSAWGKRPEGINFYYTDPNENGVGLGYSMTSGKSPQQIAIHHLDTNSDGKREVWTIMLLKGKKRFTVYEDIDSDGRLDYHYDSTTERNYVMYDNTWGLSVGEKDGKKKRSEAFVNIDGIKEKVVFQDGQWQRPPSPSEGSDSS